MPRIPLPGGLLFGIAANRGRVLSFFRKKFATWQGGVGWLAGQGTWGIAYATGSAAAQRAIDRGESTFEVARVATPYPTGEALPPYGTGLLVQHLVEQTLRRFFPGPLFGRNVTPSPYGPFPQAVPYPSGAYGPFPLADFARGRRGGISRPFPQRRPDVPYPGSLTPRQAQVVRDAIARAIQSVGAFPLAAGQAGPATSINLETLPATSLTARQTNQQANRMLAQVLGNSPQEAQLVNQVRNIIFRANTGQGPSQAAYDVVRLAERRWGFQSDTLREALLRSPGHGRPPVANPQTAALATQLQTAASAQASAQIRTQPGTITGTGRHPSFHQFPPTTAARPSPMNELRRNGYTMGRALQNRAAATLNARARELFSVQGAGNAINATSRMASRTLTPLTIGYNAYSVLQEGSANANNYAAYREWSQSAGPNARNLERIAGNARSASESPYWAGLLNTVGVSDQSGVGIGVNRLGDPAAFARRAYLQEQVAAGRISQVAADQEFQRIQRLQTQPQQNNGPASGVRAGPATVTDVEEDFGNFYIGGSGMSFIKGTFDFNCGDPGAPAGWSESVYSTVTNETNRTMMDKLAARLALRMRLSIGPNNTGCRNPVVPVAVRAEDELVQRDTLTYDVLPLGTAPQRGAIAMPLDSYVTGSSRDDQSNQNLDMSNGARIKYQSNLPLQVAEVMYHGLPYNAFTAAPASGLQPSGTFELRYGSPNPRWFGYLQALAQFDAANGLGYRAIDGAWNGPQNSRGAFTSPDWVYYNEAQQMVELQWYAARCPGGIAVPVTPPSPLPVLPPYYPTNRTPNIFPQAPPNWPGIGSICRLQVRGWKGMQVLNGRWAAKVVTPQAATAPNVAGFALRILRTCREPLTANMPDVSPIAWAPWYVAQASLGNTPGTSVTLPNFSGAQIQLIQDCVQYQFNQDKKLGKPFDLERGRARNRPT